MLELNCFCEKTSEILNGKDIIEFKKNLDEIKVDAYNWKILFKCKSCNTFWEQRHYGGTYDEAPHLIKVTKQYVNNNWGKEYLEL